MEPLVRLQQALGYAFRDESLLLRALSHRSTGAENNERLEFLGDGLINFLVGAALYHARGGDEEGALSRLRASLVREESLARLARDLRLGEYLRLGESELKSGGFRRDSILADTLEAVMAAVYLDGGFDASRDACHRLFLPLLATLPDAETLKDAKTRLQEWLQAKGRPLPRYEVLTESGPAHRRHFTVRCALVDAEVVAEADGSSRRVAEQGAAEAMLVKLGVGSQNA
jgi:ribonuclease-3